MRRSADIVNFTEFLVGNDALDIVVSRKRIENVDDLQTLRATFLGKEENYLKVDLTVNFMAGWEICECVLMSGFIQKRSENDNRRQPEQNQWFLHFA